MGRHYGHEDEKHRKRGHRDDSRHSHEVKKQARDDEPKLDEYSSRANRRRHDEKQHRSAGKSSHHYENVDDRRWNARRAINDEQNDTCRFNEHTTSGRFTDHCAKHQSTQGGSTYSAKISHGENSEPDRKPKREVNMSFDWGAKSEEKKIEKELPSFEPSGKLAEDTNTFKGVVIKYNEPQDAHMPKLRWCLYPFKDDESLPVLYIHRQSAYLIGRDRKIADLPVDHPSCSKQHAVFQYRMTTVDAADGASFKRVRPYIIDLSSANGTVLNGERIEPQRYYELREKDVLRFGFSTREFVLLNEKSCKEQSDNVKKEDLN